MSTRGTLGLLALLCVLATYIVVIELPTLRRPPRPADVPDAPPLLTTPDGAVARVDLEEADGLLTAIRHDGAWVDAAGRPWRSDAVSDLLETLATLRPIMVVDADPGTPDDYGLGHAARHLRVTGTDGRLLLALVVGDRNPAWTGLYARLTGRPEVVLVGGVLRWEIEKVRDTAPGAKP